MKYFQRAAIAILAAALPFTQACHYRLSPGIDRNKPEQALNTKSEAIKSRSGRYTYTKTHWGFEIEGPGPYGSRCVLYYDVGDIGVKVQVYRGKKWIELSDKDKNGEFEGLYSPKGFSIKLKDGGGFKIFGNPGLTEEEMREIFDYAKEIYLPKIEEIKKDFKGMKVEIPIPGNKLNPYGHLAKKRLAIEKAKQELQKKLEKKKQEMLREREALKRGILIEEK